MTPRPGPLPGRMWRSGREKSSCGPGRFPRKAPPRCWTPQGCVVSPGLIDMHCHIYPVFPYPREDSLRTISAEEHMTRCGVTTAVDARHLRLAQFRGLQGAGDRPHQAAHPGLPGHRRQGHGLHRFRAGRGRHQPADCRRRGPGMAKLHCGHQERPLLAPASGRGATRPLPPSTGRGRPRPSAARG